MVTFLVMLLVYRWSHGGTSTARVGPFAADFCVRHTADYSALHFFMKGIFTGEASVVELLRVLEERGRI